MDKVAHNAKFTAFFRPESRQSSLADDSSTASRKAERIEDAKRVQEALSSLSAEDQQLIHLRVFEEKIGDLHVERDEADRKHREHPFGASAEIITAVAETYWSCLKAPPARVSLPDTPAPASTTLESPFYLNPEKIADAIRKLVQ